MIREKKELCYTGEEWIFKCWTCFIFASMRTNRKKNFFISSRINQWTAFDEFFRFSGENPNLINVYYWTWRNSIWKKNEGFEWNEKEIHFPQLIVRFVEWKEERYFLVLFFRSNSLKKNKYKRLFPSNLLKKKKISFRQQ